MARNEIANLAESGDLAAGWFSFFVFHPCCVAGFKKDYQPFFLSSYGMPVNLNDSCDTKAILKLST